jgi:hypothetical protein
MSEFFTVTSLMAMVPDSEFSRPTLTVLPEVSMDAAGAEEAAVAPESTLLPQAASVRVAVTAAWSAACGALGIDSWILLAKRAAMKAVGGHKRVRSVVPLPGASRFPRDVTNRRNVLFPRCCEAVTGEDDLCINWQSFSWYSERGVRGAAS